MAIYLTQGGGDQAQVDEIEGKLKSAIPDLKRVPSIEAIDPKSANGAERSIVILAAAPPEDANVDDLIDAIRRHPRNLFFIVVGGDISAETTKGSSSPETPIGSPKPGCRTRLSTLSGGSARQPETMSRANRRPWFRSRRAPEAWATPPLRSKPLCNS